MTGPYTTLKYKISTAIIEAAFRNDAVECLYLWLFARALDLDLHGAPTGRIYDVPKAIKLLAKKMRRSERSIRRTLRKADADGWLSVLDDRIQIPSRAKLTLSLWSLDLGGTAPDGTTLPDSRMRDPRDSLCVAVAIPEIWDAASKGRSRSMLLDVIRERCTSYGWCRETFASLVGMARTSTARLDRAQGARRGFQFATIRLDDIVLKNMSPEQSLDTGTKFVTAYQQCRGTHGGRGQKVWLGRTHDGTPAIFTQLPVKWDTRFRGRLDVDKDVVALTNLTVSHTLLDECGSLRSVRKVVSGREDRATATNHILSDSMRDSLWRLTGDVAKAMGMTSFNRRPTIVLAEHIAWQSRTSRSPNLGLPVKTRKDPGEKQKK